MTLSRAKILYALILPWLNTVTTYNQHVAAITTKVIQLLSKETGGYRHCYEVLHSENSRILFGDKFTEVISLVYTSEKYLESWMVRCPNNGLIFL